MSPRICGCKKTTDDPASESRKLLEALRQGDKNAIISVVKHYRYDKFPSAWVEAFIHQGCVWSDAQKRLLHATFDTTLNHHFGKFPKLHVSTVKLLWKEPKHMLAFYRALVHEFPKLKGNKFGRLLSGNVIGMWWYHEIIKKDADVSPEYEECLHFIPEHKLTMGERSLCQAPLRYIPMLLKHYSSVSSIKTIVTGMRENREYVTMEHFTTILQHHPFDNHWEILGIILDATREKDEREYGFLDIYLDMIGGNAEALRYVTKPSSFYMVSQKFMITKFFEARPDLINSNAFQEFFAKIDSRDKYAFFYDTLFPNLGLQDPIQPVSSLLPLAVQAGNLAFVKRLIKTLSSDEHRKGAMLLWNAVERIHDTPWSQAHRGEAKEAENPRIAIFRAVSRELSNETYKARFNDADDILRVLSGIPREEQMWFADLWQQRQLPQLDTMEALTTLRIYIHKKGNGLGQARIQPLFTFFKREILLEAIVDAQPSTYEDVFDSMGGIFEYFLA